MKAGKVYAQCIKLFAEHFPELQTIICGTHTIEMKLEFYFFMCLALIVKENAESFAFIVFF